MRLLCILLLATAACAADQVGTWRYGVGLIDGKLAKVGTIVLTGQTIVADDAAPLRLVCSEAPGITAILAAGSSGSFAIESAGDGTRTLVVLLQRGAVQMDITDKGPFAAVRVRGAALDVRVTGTLFVVERTRRDADYVALVRGKVKVGLRPEIAKALGKAGEIELLEHQGVAGDTSSGVGAPTGLSARPQISFAAGLRTSIAEQGAGGEQGTAWDQDLAAQMTAGDLEDVAGGPGSGPSPFSQMAEDLADSLGELGAAPQAVGDQVSEAAGATPPLALPPPPPPGP